MGMYFPHFAAAIDEEPWQPENYHTSVTHEKNYMALGGSCDLERDY